jgi:hypothetical protein
VNSLALFALNATADLGQSIARELWVSLAPHEEREFEVLSKQAKPAIKGSSSKLSSCLSP